MDFVVCQRFNKFNYLNLFVLFKVVWSFYGLCLTSYFSGGAYYWHRVRACGVDCRVEEKTPHLERAAGFFFGLRCS